MDQHRLAFGAEGRLTLGGVASVIPRECYEKSNAIGLFYFVRDVLLYVGALAGLYLSDNPLVLVALWLIAGGAISALFVIGHDAAHGSLLRNVRLNALVGQVAMLPSLHAFDVWVLGHNRIHHVHTSKAGADFVWHPLTPSEYSALGPFEKARHRLEWSALGAGVYYARAIWWKGMMRLVPPERFRRKHRRDRLIIVAYMVLFGLAAAALGRHHYGSLLGAAWMWTKLFFFPAVVWNYLIGITVHLQHISPEMRWYGQEDWTRIKGQLESTTNLDAPAWINVVAHNILLHVPHHVDAGIPFYRLPAATDALVAAFPDRIKRRPLRLRDYLAATRRCKLFDFERGGWCGYVDEDPVRSLPSQT